MVEFSNNNNSSSATKLTPFYLNKGFHPYISFNPNSTSYKTTRQRLQAIKAEGISARV